MFVVWSSPDSLKVHALEEYLKSLGLRVMVRGESRSGFSGIVPPIECWSEIVVLDEQQVAETVGHIEEYFRKSRSVDVGWSCPTCGEVIEPQFTDCWRCAQRGALPESPSDVVVERLGTWSRVALALQAAFFVWLSSRLSQSGFVISTEPSWNHSEVFVPYFLLAWISWTGMLLQWNFARYLYAVAQVITLFGVVFGGLLAEEYRYVAAPMAILGIVLVVMVFVTRLRQKYGA